MIVVRVVAIVLLGALIGLFLFQCTPIFHVEDATRYRLTIEIDDHGKQRQDSKVIEKRQWVERVGVDKNVVKSMLFGEAPLIELGDGRVVVALLRCWSHPLPHQPTIIPDAGCIPDRVIYEEFGVAPGWAGQSAKGPKELRRAAMHRPVELAAGDLPVFVTFRDRNDPRTIELVDPGNLATKFGPGVTLRNASIEVTDAKIERTIKTKLPWLARWRSNPVQISYISSDGVRLTGNLHASAFTPNWPAINPTPY